MIKVERRYKNRNTQSNGFLFSIYNEFSIFVMCTIERHTYIHICIYIQEETQRIILTMPKRQASIHGCQEN
jgi:hypothetical protein